MTASKQPNRNSPPASGGSLRIDGRKFAEVSDRNHRCRACSRLIRAGESHWRVGGPGSELKGSAIRFHPLCDFEEIIEAREQRAEEKRVEAHTQTCLAQCNEAVRTLEVMTGGTTAFSLPPIISPPPELLDRIAAIVRKWRPPEG